MFTDGFFQALALLANFASVLSVIGVIRRGRPKLLAAVLVVVVVVLTGISTTLLVRNQQLTTARSEAATLSAGWPDPEQTRMRDNGTNIGYILASLQFLEKHKEQFPETYRTAAGLVNNRLNDLRPLGSSLDSKFEEDRLIEEVAGAMIMTVKQLAQ